MHGRTFSSSLLVMAWLIAPLMAEPSRTPTADMLAGCPAVFPALQGERSLLVPTRATYVAQPRASHVPLHQLRPKSDAARNLPDILKQKLAERDRLSRDIAALRIDSKMPEQIRVNVKILEVNRTKLRQLGVTIQASDDAECRLESALLGRSASGGGTSSQRLREDSCVISIDNAQLGVLDCLVTKQLGEVIADPSLVVLDGKAAVFHGGGTLNVGRASGAALEYGTTVEITATVLGDNRVRLAVHPRLCTMDSSQLMEVDGKKLPALSVREVDTAMDLRFGHSLMISGLKQQRRHAQPGSPLSKQEEAHEIALVVVATPEVVR